MLTNLKVNVDKTEETKIQRKSNRDEENWRNKKKLGSLLGDYEDMKRRVQLSIELWQTRKVFGGNQKQMLKQR